MWKTLSDIWKAKDIRSKILWTVFLLVVFRFMASIPIPFANLENLKKVFENNQVLGLLNMFSGGALERFSIVALGVNPFINASIILQLLQVIVPQLDALAKEGEQGRQILNRYTRYLTVPLAAVQSWGLIFSLGLGQVKVFDNLVLWQQLFIVLTWTTGSVFLMWLGEIITEKGIGNGTSLLIFAGIVVDFPRYIGSFSQTFTATEFVGLVLLLVIIFSVIASIVTMNEAERQVPVAYAKRVRGMKLYGGSSSHLPLRLNQAGVIPIIFASSIMLFPQMIASFFNTPNNPETIRKIAEKIVSFLSIQNAAYQIGFFCLVALFTYFYTFVTFNPDEVAENIQKQGGFIIGIRPGKPTADYLRKVLFRITLAGAIFLAFIAVLPFLLPSVLGVFSDINITSIQLQGTGLLIVVSVVLETIKQLEAMLIMRNYEGIMRKRGM